MSPIKGQRNVENFEKFKEVYLAQYSEFGKVFLKNLEKKEDWSVEVSVQDLIDTFEKLPEVCRKPFDDHDSALIENLIKLLAYLPFTESIVVLAYLGFENHDYGHAIYDIAYQCAYSDTPEMHSSLLMQRASVIQRISVLQAIQGRKS
ncbi:hypothetical protein [Vibrio sp. Hal054]|uniref:hypothetical protein n=1 Tax=Vibrio sp. Hal054 TaxID=3035158 RepID=UPI00301C9B53